MRYISRVPSLLGRLTLIFRSIRPGRKIAGSIRSARFEARMITTSLSESIPSISEQNIGTSVERMFECRDARRVPRIDSASSIKRNGMKPSFRLSRAVAKISRTIRSDSPTHMLRISGPFTCMKYSRISFPVFAPSCFVKLNAVALPISVLPRRFLAADFFPRQHRHGIEVVFVRFGAREHLQRHAVIGINADFVA